MNTLFWLVMIPVGSFVGLFVVVGCALGFDVLSRKFKRR